MRTGRRAPRTGWRALAATTLIVPGAVAAHTWAGGEVPATPWLVALSGVVLGTTVLALRRSVPALLLLPLVAATQASLHSAFVAINADGHAQHAMVGSAAPSPWTGRMLLAHVAVTVLTALVWWMCTRAVHGVLDVVRLLPAPALACRRRRPVTHRRWRPSASYGLSVAPSRGPPALPGPA